MVMPQSSVDPVVTDNVRAAVQQSGRSPRGIAIALGYSPNWLYRVIKGESGLLLPALRQLALELGVPLGSLVEEQRRGPGGGVGYLVAIPEFDTLPIPDVPRSDTGIVGWEQVPRAQLEARGTDPAECEIVRVRSTVTNLLPPEGCVVLVDRSQREPKDGRAYLLHNREELAVKRLLWDEGFAGWALVTDGPESARQRWPLWKDMVILGEALSGSAFYRSP
jgi:hypothetical protein